MAGSVTPAERRRILIDYLHMKAEECDWHGVCDASNDLRELEAAHPESLQPDMTRDEYIALHVKAA